MRDEIKTWLQYSGENLDAANVLLKRNLYNPCLQNVQQSVEKALKALCAEKEFKIKKTHSITELKNIIDEKGIVIELSEEDCEFIDSIYLPSKYPLYNVLPHFVPDKEICTRAVLIAEATLRGVKQILNL